MLFLFFSETKQNVSLGLYTRSGTLAAQSAASVPLRESLRESHPQTRLVQLRLAQHSSVELIITLSSCNCASFRVFDMIAHPL